jgi:hypothetical protein
MGAVSGPRRASTQPASSSAAATAARRFWARASRVASPAVRPRRPLGAASVGVPRRVPGAGDQRAVEDGERVAQRHAGLREGRGSHRGGVADGLAVHGRIVLCVAQLGVVVVVVLGIVQLPRLREHRVSEHAHNHSSSFVVGPFAEING